jgi:hypothetical protein
VGGFRSVAVTETRRPAGFGPRGGAALANDRYNHKEKQ